jgi:hypothetical protein
MGLISEGVQLVQKVQIVQNVLNGLNGVNVLNQRCRLQGCTLRLRARRFNCRIRVER